MTPAHVDHLKTTRLQPRRSATTDDTLMKLSVILMGRHTLLKQRCKAIAFLQSTLKEALKPKRVSG